MKLINLIPEIKKRILYEDVREEVLINNMANEIWDYILRDLQEIQRRLESTDLTRDDMVRVVGAHPWITFHNTITAMVDISCRDIMSEIRSLRELPWLEDEFNGLHIYLEDENAGSVRGSFGGGAEFGKHGTNISMYCLASAQDIQIEDHQHVTTVCLVRTNLQEMDRRFRSTFVHEFGHFVQYVKSQGRRERGGELTRDDEGFWDEYYNRPHEIDSRVRETINYIERVLIGNGELISTVFKYFVDELEKGAHTIGSVTKALKLLTPENRQKFLQRVGRYWQERVVELIEGEEAVQGYVDNLKEHFLEDVREAEEWDFGEGPDYDMYLSRDPNWTELVYDVALVDVQQEFPDMWFREELVDEIISRAKAWHRREITPLLS